MTFIDERASGNVDVADVTYVLNPHLRIVRCSDDELLVRHGARSLYSQVLTDPGRMHLLARLVDGFRIPTTLEAIRSAAPADDRDAFGSSAETMVGTLVHEGVLVEPTPSLGEVYLRTIIARQRGDRHDGLAARKVALVGGGALGRLVADDLAAAGIGALRVADSRGRDGSTNAEALRAALGDPPAALALEVVPGDPSTTQVLEPMLEESDLVVVAWETFSPALFHAVNGAALQQRIPWLLVYVDGAEAVIGPLVVPGETSCYLEYEIQVEASLVQRDSYELYKEELADLGKDLEPYVLSPYAKVAAGLASASALAFLAGAASPSPNRVIRFDFERFAIDYQDVLRLPRCPACGHDRPAYRQLFL